MDIMIGVVLGLGFQWWPNLSETWQFLAFILAYLLIVDYWIDTGSALKKFPPKRELDIILDVTVMFSFFLFIYSTQATIEYFLWAFILFRILDIFWILRVKAEYKPTHHDELVMNTWMFADCAEILSAFALLSLESRGIAPLSLLGAFIVVWLVIRVVSSLRYKKVFI